MDTLNDPEAPLEARVRDELSNSRTTQGSGLDCSERGPIRFFCRPQTFCRRLAVGRSARSRFTIRAAPFGHPARIPDSPSYRRLFRALTLV